MKRFSAYLKEETEMDIEKILSKYKFTVKKSAKTEVYIVKANDRLSTRNQLSSELKTNKIKHEIKSSSKSSFDPIFITGTNITILFKPEKTGSDAKSTAMQERASAWIFKRVLNDNKKYNSPEDILKDPKFQKEVMGPRGMYPGVPDDWIVGFYAQQNKMLDEFSKSKFTEFNRDGGFMDYITKLVSSMGIRQKDTWNPADIWLVNNEAKVIKEIEDALGKVKIVTELNAIMKRLYNERRLVGVSLKKISGKEARYEEINVNEIFGLSADYSFTIKWSDSRLTLTTDKDGKFDTQDLTIIAESKKATVKFQIKQNDSSKKTNLKFEPTQKGAGSARLGKVPVDMLASLLKEYNIKFINDNRRYPITLNEYNRVSSKYKMRFDKIKTKVNVGARTADEFSKNIERAFMSSNKKYQFVALSKLMQIDFLYEFLQASKKIQEEVITDMVFLAMKKGKNFGPHGKLY